MKQELLSSLSQIKIKWYVITSVCLDISICHAVPSSYCSNISAYFKVRHIDHISVPSPEFHKCNMLYDDLPNIKYHGGLTYTLGALVEAQVWICSFYIMLEVL